MTPASPPLVIPLLRALTVTQPWAGLIASGLKLVENRSRRFIGKQHLGTRIAIHAGRAIDEDVYARVEEIAPEFDWCRPRFGSCDLVGRHAGAHWTVGCHDGQLAAPDALSWRSRSRVTSAVIAVATLDRVIEVEDDIEPPEVGGYFDPSYGLGDQRRWFFGPIGYVFRAVVALPAPVACKGMRGLWTLPVPVAAQVRAQLQVAA